MLTLNSNRLFFIALLVTGALLLVFPYALAQRQRIAEMRVKRLSQQQAQEGLCIWAEDDVRPEANNTHAGLRNLKFVQPIFQGVLVLCIGEFRHAAPWLRFGHKRWVVGPSAIN